MKIKPFINAGNLTSGELRDWILKLAKNAEIAGWGTETSVRKLQAQNLACAQLWTIYPQELIFWGQSK